MPSYVDCLASASFLVRLVVVQGFAGNTCVELSILPSGVRVELELELLWDDDDESEDPAEVIEEEELLRELLLVSAIANNVVVQKIVMFSKWFLFRYRLVFQRDPLVRSFG